MPLTRIGTAAIQSSITGSNITDGSLLAEDLATTSDFSFYGVRVGRGAGAVSTNTALGTSALATNMTGSTNTAVGYVALLSNTTGSNNTSVGTNSSDATTTGANNTAIGVQALNANTIGSDSTAIGYRALYVSNRTADANAKNTAIGSGSGSAITTGSKNVIIGSYNGLAAPISATGSNYIVLSDGDGNVRQTIDSSGNVGIDVTVPAVKLDVLGTVQAATAAIQDAVRLAGRTGGTGTFAVTLTPTTLTASRTLTLPDATTTVVGTDATQTLTNKRITPRVQALSTNSGTYAIDTDSYDMVVITGQNVNITDVTTTGTPTNGQKLWFSVTGTAARTISFNASNFESSTVALPTTTVTTARLDIGFVWNVATSKWRCVAVA